MTPAPVLPHLDDDRVARIERDVFRRIADDRARARRRRIRAWSGGAAAAAVLLVAAVIAPQLTPALSASSESGSAVAPVTGAEPVPVPDGGGQELAPSGGAADAAAPSEGTREVLSTALATVTVPDATAAAQRITDAATARGGYVESQSIGVSPGAAAGGSAPESWVTDGSGVATLPYPMPGDDSITVRVPADQLTALLDELSSIGEVTSSSVSRQDVTDQAIDLRARIAASEASVQRLTELMSQAAAVADLIAAESALAERQATLESDRQQLAALEGQVELSTLTVRLVPASAPVSADPAGFGDGLAAGWNGLVATLNGIVVALGFLLPWLVVIGAAAAIVWAIVRLARRRRPAAPSE